MTPEAQRIAIARAMGIEVLITPNNNPSPYYFEPCGRKVGWGDGDWKLLPDYLSDLNAIHAVLLTLDGTLKPNGEGMLWSERLEFNVQLEWIIYLDTKKVECLFECYLATAKQLCEAFLRVKGLWKE